MVIRDGLGGTKFLEKKTGISQSYLSRLMRGVIENPGILQLIKIAEAGERSLDWLIFGAGVDDRVTESIDYLEENKKYYIDYAVMHNLGLKRTQCRMHTYHGDSLNIYKTGDELLVNVDDPKGDGIYLIDFGNGLSVRRLSWIPGNMVNVISDNYGSNQVASDDLNIVGKVVWTGTRQ